MSPSRSAMTVTQAAAPPAAKPAAVRRIEPTAALFVGKRPRPKMFLAPGTTEEHRVDKPEQTSIMGVQSDHRMQVQTIHLPGIPYGRGVLDRQDVASFHQSAWARPG